MMNKDKIFFLIYFVAVILFLIVDILVLDLSFKQDLLACFVFLIIFNLYTYMNKK